MAILVNERTGVVVQGVTGRQAAVTARLMKDYGTRVLAGVTPGKGGEKVWDIPVFNTVQEAKENFPEIEASTILVPARLAKSAVIEAIESSIRVIVIHPERLPHHDMLEIVAYAQEAGVHLIGPNTAGLICPGRILLGMIGGSIAMAHTLFAEGPCGVISRSGGNTTTVSYYLTKAGVGQSTSVGIGGDTVVGSTFADLLPLFEEDERTKAVAIFGEIGTTAEEDAAQLICSGKFTKPLIAYVAGKYSLPNTRFGHAGAIITQERETAIEKMEVLKRAGAFVVDHLDEIGEKVNEVLRRVQ